MIRRPLMMVLGFCALALAGLGILLPVLPTTPFVICAAGCFSATSPRLYQKLAGTKYFGEYIQNYKQKTGISNKARWTGLIFLWTALVISAIAANSLHVYIALAIVGVCVSIHILTIRRARNKNN